MTNIVDWPSEATADDLRNAILLCLELGLEEEAPTLQLLRRKLGAKLRLDDAAVPWHTE